VLLPVLVDNGLHIERQENELLLAAPNLVHRVIFEKKIAKNSNNIKNSVGKMFSGLFAISILLLDLELLAAKVFFQLS
jgi:hypothetical protein